MAEVEHSELKEIQAAIAKQNFAGALEALEELLAESPEHGDALYFKAVCLRYLREYQQARRVLDRLLECFPQNGRGHQELGHWYRDQGRLDQALQAYNRACQLNPALAASFKARLQILRKLGRSEEATRVYNQLQQLETLPEPLIAVTDLLYQGKLLRAEDLCRSFLARYPHHVEAMRLLAEIGVRLGIMDDAEFLLESAVEFDPENVSVRMDYVQVLRKQQRFEKALLQARHLLELGPSNPQYQSLYAIVSMQGGDYAEALRYFDRILEGVPGDPATHTSKGHALKTMGDFDAAVDSYRQAYIHKPDHGEAFYSLSNLKTYRFTADELARMQELEQSERVAANDRIHVYFALGKAHEDAADYARSFGYYASGNRLKKAESRYEADQMSADLAAQKTVCTRALFEDKRGMGCGLSDPIFIVGLPRAGSTLLEQILSSHSQVDGTLELPNILSLSHRLRRAGRQSDERRGYPNVLQDLTADELQEYGEHYLRDTRIHRQGAPMFTDKMPNNFRHIGLIKLILPNAKIIDARREPMACCFSGFKQLFAEGQEFSYDLTDIGRYYRDYVDLMSHWDTVLPDFVLRVQHEDVVADLESEVRRILDFCGLPFEDACLRYFETERNIRTPSSEQVRQPIFTDSIEQWQHFEPWLGPLKSALHEAHNE
jgi:tetratricopeptide (TPR) repeat protein